MASLEREQREAERERREAERPAGGKRAGAGRRQARERGEGHAAHLGQILVQVLGLRHGQPGRPRLAGRRFGRLRGVGVPHPRRQLVRQLPVSAAFRVRSAQAGGEVSVRTPPSQPQPQPTGQGADAASRTWMACCVESGLGASAGAAGGCLPKFGRNA